MDPWFTEGSAASKREAKENVALGLRGTAGIVEPQRYVDALWAAIEALPAPAEGEAISTRAQLRVDPGGLPVQSFTIEVAIYRKG